MTQLNLLNVLDSVIAESYKTALARAASSEQDRQEKVASDIKDYSKSTNTSAKIEEDDENKEQTPSKTVDAEKEKLKKGDVKVDDIIDKLNSIRSGKSFKDEKIHNAMNEYVDSLTKAEKTALLAFLKGIAQIITGEVAGDVALEPEDTPANVKMKKTNKGVEGEKKTIKPNVIKKVATASKKDSVENTSAPIPIKPVKK